MAFRAEIDDFAAFYASMYRRAFRTALAIVGDPTLADDVTQDAFVAAFRARGRFRGDAPAEAWLIRIVANRAISAARHRRLRWAEPLDPARPAGGDESERAADRMSVRAAILTLPPDQRAAVVLRYYLDYDYATIARTLDTNVGTVGSWLSRASVALATILDDANESTERSGARPDGR